MRTRTWVARNLAAAFLSNDWTPDAMEEAACAALGESAGPDWLPKLIAEVLAQTTCPYPPSPRKLAGLILASDAFDEQWHLGERRPAVVEIVTSPPKFAPTAKFQDTGVPQLTTLGELADWLHLPFSLIAWLAALEGYRASAATDSARHYTYRWIPKSAGPPRLIEAPKSILKIVQRQILRGILDQVPLHDCAHGFRKGRSCISAAQLHAGESIVVSADLKDFFLSVPLGRVHALFRSLGYPWSVARLLTALCSTATPRDVIERLPQGCELDAGTRMLVEQRHLPQGAPTSPSLANLAAWRLDCRLSGLARRLDARYTRYGDDLAFSGDHVFAQRLDRFVPMVAHICADTGLRLNRRKTRIMGQAGRQRLLGLTVNRHVNIPRKRYERLKAILHNCLRHGPDSQNRAGHPDFRAHLDGQITWVENVNLRKGHRLRLLFQQADWP